MWLSKLGSRLDTTTFFSLKVGVGVSCGCFLGTLDEFEEKVKATHKNNQFGKEYTLAIELAKVHFGIEK